MSTVGLANTLRWLALAVALAAAATGCKDKGAATTPQGEDTSSKQAAGAGAKGNAGAARRSQGDTRKGWRWKGARDNCYFLVGKTCFETRDSACSEAGCSGDACQASSGIPARVSCAN